VYPTITSAVFFLAYVNAGVHSFYVSIEIQGLNRPIKSILRHHWRRTMLYSVVGSLMTTVGMSFQVKQGMTLEVTKPIFMWIGSNKTDLHVETRSHKQTQRLNPQNSCYELHF
jgi:hypothetical protein